MTQTAKSPARGPWPSVLALVLMVLAGIAVAEFGLGAYHDYVASSDNLDSGMFQADPQLGWSLKPAWSGHHRHHDFRTRYTIDGDGRRYDPTAGAELDDAPQVWLAGDSDTFGLGVGNRETFSAELNRWVRARVRFVNLGVPGYSTEQAMLTVERHLRGGRPRTVILVTNLADDLLDNGAPFSLSLDNPKPFFRLEEGRLTLHNSPVPRAAKTEADRARTFESLVLGDGATPERGLLADLAARSSILAALGVQWPRPHDIGLALPRRTGPSLDLYEALVDRLQATLKARGAGLVLALLPDRAYLRRPHSHAAQYQEYLRQQIIARLRGRVEVVDVALALTERLRRQDLEIFFPNAGHLNSTGHRQVGEILRTALVF
ncbi:MAG: hypothetical protein H6907_16390 [Hyphomicrobiales bacterium]|nr:hypothetical protein [Hyphomicrobiales bacterium]MCP5373306.1 hypothetical protein [Hyphomicrobiales bacterium]